MGNSIKPQNPRNVFQHQSHPSNRQRPPGGVRQDKYAFERVRIASAQPVRITKGMRTQQLRTKNIRQESPAGQFNNSVKKARSIDIRDSIFFISLFGFTDSKICYIH